MTPPDRSARDGAAPAPQAGAGKAAAARRWIWGLAALVAVLAVYILASQ